MAKQYVYQIAHPGDRAAGLVPYTDTITVIVDSGQPGGEPKEFETQLQRWLWEWFDGAGVSEAEVTEANHNG